MKSTDNSDLNQVHGGCYAVNNRIMDFKYFSPKVICLLKPFSTWFLEVPSLMKLCGEKNPAQFYLLVAENVGLPSHSLHRAPSLGFTEPYFWLNYCTFHLTLTSLQRGLLNQFRRNPSILDIWRCWVSDQIPCPSTYNARILNGFTINIVNNWGTDFSWNWILQNTCMYQNITHMALSKYLEFFMNLLKINFTRELFSLLH